MSKEPKSREIPFVKPARIGNFKVWRSKMSLGKGKEKKVDIEQINISTLDGTWQVKIPATFEMFALLRDLYSEHTAGVEDQRTAQLSTIFGNMLYASCVANGYFHSAINICTTIYANPNLLKADDENHLSFMEDVKSLIDGFLEWRKEYEAHVEENQPTEEELNSDQVVEDMVTELNKQE